MLQFAGLLIAALLFLPNVGLWSLYRDRMFENSPELVEGPGGISKMQVGLLSSALCEFVVENWERSVCTMLHLYSFLTCC